MTFWVVFGLTIEDIELEAHFFFAIPREVDPTCRVEIVAMMESLTELFIFIKNMFSK